MLITKEEVLQLRRLFVMCRSLRKKFSSYGVFMSCADHKGRSFKVAGSICHGLINKEEVLKLPSLFVMC